MGEWHLTIGRALLQFFEKKKNQFADWLIELVFYREKNRSLSFLLLSLFIFFSSHLQPWSAARVVFSTIPQSFGYVLFHDATFPGRFTFWNRMPQYFASARGAYKLLAYWNMWQDTGPADQILGNTGALQKY